MEITEEYAEQQLLKDAGWFDEHSEELKMLRNAINMFLHAGNINSLYKLCTFFSDGVLIESFKGVPDIAYCIIGINIMMKEFNMHYDETLFFKNVFSIDDAINKINGYKFQILNIEFDFDRQEKLKLLLEDLIHNRISPIALLYLIKCSAVDTQYVLGIIRTYIDAKGYDEQNNVLAEVYNALFG